MTKTSIGRIGSTKTVKLGNQLAPLIFVSAIVLAAVIAIRPLAVPPSLPSAATGGFIIDRAFDDLTTITVEPRVPGIAGYCEAQAYLVAELEAMGPAFQCVFAPA